MAAACVCVCTFTYSPTGSIYFTPQMLWLWTPHMYMQLFIFHQQWRGRLHPACRVGGWWRGHHRPRGSLQSELRQARRLSARSRNPETLHETQQGRRQSSAPRVYWAIANTEEVMSSIFLSTYTCWVFYSQIPLFLHLCQWINKRCSILPLERYYWQCGDDFDTAFRSSCWKMK